MKLLFITQKVDKDDDVLGVYHQWIKGLASKFENISVICLYQGRTELPGNVRVRSLGKEKYPSRANYLWRFYRLIWGLRREYDVVFVHMNPEYVILGGLFWKLMGKRITLWYAHYLANWKIRAASLLADKIVTSTRLAYPLTSRKLEVLQQGIDTERFKPRELKVSSGGGSASGGQNSEFKVLFLGRIAPVKDLETLLRALALVRKVNAEVVLTIVGSPTAGRPAEEAYYRKIQELVRALSLTEAVKFRPAVPNDQTPAIYNSQDLFVNLTVTGSFDKSTLEAMSCSLPVAVSNLAFLEIFPSQLHGALMFPEKNAEVLARRIADLAKMSGHDREKIGLVMRSLIIAKHGLNDLMDKLAGAIQSA